MTNRNIDVAPEPSTAAEGPRRWRFTADQYQRMGELGILHEDDRVELLDGELYEMAPIGDWHNATVDGLTWWLGARVGTRGILRVQGSIRLSAASEPQPDLVVLRFRADFYHGAKAEPADVLLIVEVADSSLDYDLQTKLPLYARSRIPELWIVNRAGDRIEVYRDPAGGRYQTVHLAERGATIALLAFPDIAIPVDAILG